MIHSINDNEPIMDDFGVARRAFVSNEPNGQAAVLLVESLIHGLIARSIITVNDAIEIIHTASDVSPEFAEQANDADRIKQNPFVILEGIAASLGHDLPEKD